LQARLAFEPRTSSGAA